jgi:Hydantoinase B/oxoprolinase
MSAPFAKDTACLSLRAAGPRPSPRNPASRDPITFEVIRHRLGSINQEVSTTIMHASGSPVVHTTDYNFGIYMPNGGIAISGTFYMIPLCPMTMMIQFINECFVGEIHEGDVFVTNDPFLASVHQNEALYFRSAHLPSLRDFALGRRAQMRRGAAGRFQSGLKAFARDSGKSRRPGFTVLAAALKPPAARFPS